MAKFEETVAKLRDGHAWRSARLEDFCARPGCAKVRTFLKIWATIPEETSVRRIAGRQTIIAALRCLFFVTHNSIGAGCPTNCFAALW